MRAMRDAYRSLTGLIGVISIGLGIAILVETVILGGGVGYVIGVLFVALGIGRLYLLRRRQ